MTATFLSQLHLDLVVHKDLLCFCTKNLTVLRTSLCNDISQAFSVTLQIPIGGEDNFQGMVDLVRMKGIIWDGEVNVCVQY